MKPVRDMLGTDIQVNDLFAFGVQEGYSSYLRVGRVVEVIDHKRTVRCEWIISSGYGMIGTKSIVQNPQRGLVLTPDVVQSIAERD